MRMKLLLSFALAACLAASAGAQAVSTFSIDIGGDTDYEWRMPVGFTGWPMTMDAEAALDRYVRGGCWCTGCIEDAVSGDCIVPVVFRAPSPGQIRVNDINLTFEKSTLLRSVGYGRGFRKSDGCRWTIDFTNGNIVQGVPYGYSGPDACLYIDGNHNPPADREDATDDAVYRLLNETLDLNRDGKVDVETHGRYRVMSEGDMQVQNMWGPVSMRLIVWA